MALAKEGKKKPPRSGGGTAKPREGRVFCRVHQRYWSSRDFNECPLCKHKSSSKNGSKPGKK
ncbi:hypothetical protein O9K51_02393 [Purpureocillium lavendulum]|uniref:Uncharacterized protein n=1 Tax=Purpureocillium lavendulum TaxID=1247861 RepID=A0AB34FY19_9HYPO|nr:hypothetical protein O9K51_02393 [Purpureocillium lavendulum]